MQAIDSEADFGRYLVSSGNPGKLNEFISASHHDPALKLLDTIGPAGAPHTAVYQMAHVKATDLKRQFGQAGELHIEPDQRLSMFGNP